MTRQWICLVVGCVMIAVSAVPAAAQDRPSVGLVFAYPGAAGIQWDIAERFGIRVDGGYERHETTFTIDYSRLLPPPGFPVPPPRTETSITHMASFGVSPQFVIGPVDSLKIYVAPRVGVSVNRAPRVFAVLVAGTSLEPLDESTVITTSLPEREEDQTDYAFDAGARAGASYRLGTRFAMFGEAGFSLDRNSRANDVGKSRTSSMRLVAGIGGILYF